MKTITKAVLGFFAGIIVLAIIGAMVAPPEPTPEEVAGYNSTSVRNYEIVMTEDISALGLDFVRKEYRIVVPTYISREELKSTMIQVVIDKTSENPQIKAIRIFAYDREEDADDFYTYGRAIWGPDGEVAPTDAPYRYNFEISKKVGNIDTLGRPTEREFEIYDTFKKALDEDLDTILNENKGYDVLDAEEVIRKRVAKELGISEEELSETYGKVVGYLIT